MKVADGSECLHQKKWNDSWCSVGDFARGTWQLYIKRYILGFLGMQKGLCVKQDSINFCMPGKFQFSCICSCLSFLLKRRKKTRWGRCPSCKIWSQLDAWLPWILIKILPCNYNFFFHERMGEYNTMFNSGVTELNGVNFFFQFISVPLLFSTKYIRPSLI